MSGDSEAPQADERRAPAGLFGVGVAAFAVACCASAPLVVGLLGGATLGAVLGLGGGALAALALGGLVFVALRRRGQACRAPGSGEARGGARS